MKWRARLLWLLAFVAVLAAASWQRRSGPSYPLRGSLELDESSSVDYRLVRNENTDRDAVVGFPAAPEVQSVELRFRRHGTTEPFRVRAMQPGPDGWEGRLPRQPAAGKLDYYLTVNDTLRVPVDEAQFAVIRYKDPVPAAVLIPHILMMFLSMFCGVRAAIAAFTEPLLARRLAWVTLGCLGVGGLILGPVVQKYAFGAFWTGWPVGEDLTDTKTLVTWLGWFLAVALLGVRRPVTAKGRAAVVFAALLMVAVYLVPHSMRGSTLDYEQLDEGTPAGEAIRTG